MKKDTPDNKNLVRIFYIGLALVALLNYGKLLWPEMWGNMHKNNVSFWEAFFDLEAHAYAISIFTIGTVVAIIYYFFISNEK